MYTDPAQRLAEADFPIAILGAGFGGLGMGIKLKEAGIDSFVIFEREDEVGGTWRDNTYPGCACDVPSHLYSFSFEQNPNWSRAFGEQWEIQQYLLHCTEKYGLRKHIRFNTKIVKAEFDEDAGLWTFESDDGENFTARVVISGVGGLSNPSYPNIPGLDSYQGKLFHTAEWDHDYDLKDKRVAVVGSGASAIQAVPAIAPETKELHVFQRTPSWIMPKPDREIKGWEKRLFRWFPPLLWLRRLFLYWLYEMYAPLVISDKPWRKRLLKQMALRHMRNQIKDEDLRRKVKPDYKVGCKRILISNDWYPALTRDNVNLITEGIAKLTPTGIVTENGNQYEMDAVIMATGFKVPSAGAPFAVKGRNGHRLEQDWAQGAEAYKGVTVAGFPNLFFMLGPNTGPGHTSVLVYLEKQIEYAVQAIRTMRKRGLKFLDVKPSVQEEFNEELQERMQDTVWTSGCASWYLAPNGKNTTLYPGFATEYRLRVRKFKPSEYLLMPATDSKVADTVSEAA